MSDSATIAQVGSANLHNRGKLSERVAAMFNVSTRSVDSALKLLDSGAPELVAAVDGGTVAISVAALVADLPVGEQQRLVAEGPSAIRAAAKGMRAGGRKKKRRRASKVSAPQAHEEGGELVLRVGSHWRSQIEAAMKNRIEFERALGVGLKIKLEKGQKKGDDASPSESVQSVL